MGIKIDRFMCSPFKRTIQSAKHVWDVFNAGKEADGLMQRGAEIEFNIHEAGGIFLAGQG